MTKRRSRGRPKYKDILTPAEWRVVEGIRHGMTSRQIANRRGISIDAVKYHVANILQKLQLSNRGELRMWDGVAKNTALFSKEKTMTEKTALGSIGQISRNVKNIQASCDWYANVLGFEHLFSFGDIAFFNCGGVRLFLNQSDGDLLPDSIIYFQVENISLSQSELEARGVTFINAPHMINTHEDGTEEWMAFFKDIDGRPLALMAQVKPKN